MAILDIQTNNPDISWVIYKNPNTQNEQNKPFQRTLRQGNVYGWYNGEHNFRIFFKDGEGKSSFYKNLNNDYLDQSAYNAPYVYCAMISEMLSATANKKHEKDILVENKISISSILITNMNIAKSFVNYFADKVKIELKELSKKVYSIDFIAKESLYYLTNLVQVFCLIQALEDKNNYIDMTEGALKKYATNLINMEAPYFIVYLFLSRCVPDIHSFNLIKKILEQKNWVLNYGNTQKQRFSEIKKLIKNGNVLHDLGCGELYYSRNLASFYNKIYAWDADESIQTRNKGFIEKKQLSNIMLRNEFTTTSALEIQEGSDILITEMLEHMPKDEAKNLLLEIKNLKFRKLIITVPNKDFNQFYKLETEFRHDDHQWEPTYEEIKEWIEKIFIDEIINIKPIGDGINGIHVSTLIHIENGV